MEAVSNDYIIFGSLALLLLLVVFQNTIFVSDSKDANSDEKDAEKGKVTTLLKRYQTLLVRYPLLMNALQSGFISSCSVITSQFVAGKSFDEINWIEVRTMCVIAMFFITPTLLAFYGVVLEKLHWGVIGKLIVDQLLFSPLFTAAIITLRFVVLGEVPLREIPGLVIQIVPKAVFSSWTFWIPARAFTLKFVPPHLHLLTGNMMSFVWNIIFSLLLSK
jgi:hypothetical protein